MTCHQLMRCGQMQCSGCSGCRKHLKRDSPNASPPQDADDLFKLLKRTADKMGTGETKKKSRRPGMCSSSVLVLLVLNTIDLGSRVASDLAMLCHSSSPMAIPLQAAALQ